MLCGCRNGPVREHPSEELKPSLRHGFAKFDARGIDAGG
jgi:hypothetical protein